jgi:hypothetical protein
MKNFLLKSLSNDAKSMVTEMSGCKPLYAQYLGKIAQESGGIVPPENELLQNVNICTHIAESIYQEKRQDDYSKKILELLAYHPESTMDWIATKLKFNAVTTKNKLMNLVRFDTVRESDGKYRIVGKLIERYGKEICDDPCKKGYQEPLKPLKERVIPIIRWTLMIVVLISAIWLYFYTHPSVDMKSVDFSNGTITLDVPRSVETDERGTLIVSVTNAENTSINSLKLLFFSADIRYDIDGRSSLSFSNIGPHETSYGTINYLVLSGSNNISKTEIIISDHEQPIFFDMNRRELQFKQYEPLSSVLLAVLSLLSLFIPGKSWIPILESIKQLVSSVKKEKQ